MGLKKHRKRLLKLARTAARQLGKEWVEKVFRSACELIEEALKTSEAGAVRERAKASPTRAKKAAAKTAAPPTLGKTRRAARSGSSKGRRAEPSPKPKKRPARRRMAGAPAGRAPRPGAVEIPLADAAPPGEAEATSAGMPEAQPTP